MNALTAGLDLRAALRRTRETGAAHVSGALDERFRRDLAKEVDAGPFERMEGEFGRGVRMQIDGYDVGVPMDGFPLLRELVGELAILVREQGRGIRGLATWAPNEVGIARYRPGSIGITPHLDGRWYRRLVAVVTAYGRARFAVCRTREGEVVEEWHPGPGDLVLLRAPGLGGVRDGRPFHLAEGPRRGERCSLGIRMAVPAPR